MLVQGRIMEEVLMYPCMVQLEYDPQICAKSSGSGATTRENWVGRLFGLRNSVLGPPTHAGVAR